MQMLSASGMFYYFVFSYFGSYNFICGNYRFFNFAWQVVNGTHLNLVDLIVDSKAIGEGLTKKLGG